MNHHEILTHIEKEISEIDITSIEDATPQGIVIPANELLRLMKFFHQNELLYFDMLSCISGVDNGPDLQTLEVIYQLYSIPFNHHLMVKVILDRSNPVIESVCDIWRTANWYEREVYDMFGIQFNNHPDLRRILLPADWEGFPLLKDYHEQEKYHGIIVQHEDKQNRMDHEK